jgi:hypothetical protein
VLNIKRLIALHSGMDSPFKMLCDAALNIVGVECWGAIKIKLLICLPDKPEHNQTRISAPLTR